MLPFRFIHASDFHLEQPLGGLAELADHLRELFVEAPYRAAANVFDAALRHQVDFVVLSGDLVCPERSGPRGLLFLREHFGRLAERGVQVYWCGGRVDPAYDWPRAVKWPANVHVFGATRPLRETFTRHGQTLCEIVGQSRSVTGAIDTGGFERSEAGVFAIGAAHGDFTHEALSRRPIDYWALGGQHEPTLPQEACPLVHYSGSPQGRLPDECGPHGCTLVEVDHERQIRTTPIVTDVVRFEEERITVPAEAVAGDVEKLLREHTEAVAAANAGAALVVSLTLEGLDGVGLQQRSKLPLPAMVGVLRGEFGYRAPPAWVNQVTQSPAHGLPDEWYRREDLLGDYLRMARERMAQGAIELGDYLPRNEAQGAVAELARLDDQAVVRAALAEAASLGAGLLTAQEACP
jgi:DNA repair exonuclease SbcCD nuclease subunit